MTPLSDSEKVKCSFCNRDARWHFGTELWRKSMGYVMGLRFFKGETLHTCGGCGLRLRRWADSPRQQAWDR